MELVFVIVIGAGIGLLLRYLIPGREGYGLLLLPCLAAAVTAAVWVGLLWLGFTFDGGWIWALSLIAATGASLATALVLPRRRRTADARLLTELSGGKA